MFLKCVEFKWNFLGLELEMVFVNNFVENKQRCGFGGYGLWLMVAVRPKKM